jgi:hypothetical protein
VETLISFYIITKFSKKKKMESFSTEMFNLAKTQTSIATIGRFLVASPGLKKI